MHLDTFCFPGSARVQLEDGNQKSMKDLAVGDRVLVAPNRYSEVGVIDA